MFLARMKKMLLASAVMLGGLCSTALAQTSEDTKVLSSSILPKDTYLYMSVPSVSDMKEQFMESSAGKMWEDPAMADFRAELEKAFASEMEQGMAQVQEALGMTLQELLNVPTGEVSLAFSKAPPNKMGAILFLDYGDHEEQVKGLLEKALGGLSGVPTLQAANFEHAGTEVVLFSIKADIAKRTPLAKEFGWFLKDQRMVLSNSSALLKLTLDNWNGEGEKTLAKNEVYSYIIEKCETEPGDGMMVTYFDPIGLFTQLVQTGSLGEAGMQAGLAISVFPMLGANQLKGIGSVSEVGGEEFEGVSRSMIYCEQPPQGAMQMFQLAETDPTPPTWVKEGTVLWMATTWKVEEAYNAVATMVDMFQGAGAFEGIIDRLAQDGPQIHIKNDIIDQLDGKLQITMASGEGETATGSDDILFAMGVRDTEKMAEFLSKLTSQPGFPGETRELEGATIYEIDNPSGGKISFTAANNFLFVSVGGTQLEAAIRNQDDVRPLAETDEFKAVAEHFQEGALLVGFTRPSEQYRKLYEMVQSGNAADNFPGMDELFSKIDFTKLPPFEAMEKYFAPTGTSWVGDENGVMMEQFSLPVAE